MQATPSGGAGDVQKTKCAARMIKRHEETSITDADCQLTNCFQREQYQTVTGPHKVVLQDCRLLC